MNNSAGAAIILVQPQMGENIGACARVMSNFDLSDLRLVNPRDKIPNAKALSTAKHAAHIIQNAQIFSSITEACRDINILYATTIRDRDINKASLSAKEAAADINLNLNIKYGLLFGPERSGLSNEDVSYANKIISIPTSKDYSSLNLSQAVAIICYEIFNGGKNNAKICKNLDLATVTEVNYFIKLLSDSLSDTKFFQVEEKKAGMIQNITNIFTRNNLSSQEVRTLNGIIKALAEKTSKSE